MSDRRQPQDHVAVALAGAMQGAEPVNDADIQLDQSLALGVGLRLVVHAAEDHRGDLERRLADGDLDHRFTDGYRLVSSSASTAEFPYAATSPMSA